MTQGEDIRVDETQGGSPVNKPPERLEFKPDEQRLARLARLRKVTLWVTLILLAASLAYLIMFPKRLLWVSPQSQSLSPGKEAGSEKKSPATGLNLPSGLRSESLERLGSSVAAADDEVKILHQALTSGQLIDSIVNIAFIQWERAESLLDFDKANIDKVEDMMEKIRTAKVVSESGKCLVRIVQREMEKLKTMSKASGLVFIRVNAIYGAALEYWNYLVEEMANQEAFFDAWGKAVEALGNGDKVEFEIKGTVATGYLRKSESCRRRFQRARIRLRETFRIQ